jgi:hypothetical protein
MSQNYDARIRELHEQVNKQVKDTHEKLSLTVKLTAYGGKRKQFLGALAAAIAASQYKTPKAQESWKDTVNKLGEGLMKALPSAKDSGDEPSLAYLGFLSVTAAQESRFIKALGASAVGKHVDALLTITRRLEEKTRNLQEIWKRLHGTDRTYDEKALQVTKELENILEDAITQAAAKHQTLRERLAEAIQIFDRLPEGITELPLEVLGPLGNVLSVVTKALGSSAEVWGKAVERTVEREVKLEGLFRAEANLMVMFTETRKEVMAFVRDVNFDKARGHYVEVDRALVGLVSSAATPGQKADLEAFRKELMAALGKKLDEAEKQHDVFVKENQSKFYGPLSAQIKEELFETRQWTDVLKRFQTPSLNTRLRDWYKRDFFTVSLNGLERYQREYLEKQLNRQVDALMKVLNEVDRKVLGKPPEQQIAALRKVLEDKVR